MQGRGDLGREDSHWTDMTDRWMHVSRPLKPGLDDIAVYEYFAARAARESSPGLAALVLGVTPEIVGCRWPQGTRLTAVDFSRSMIDVLWNAPRASEASYVICADWRAMPIGSRNIDLVLGDGCNAALSFPDGLRAVMGEVARVLRPGGLFLLRAFVRPEPGETVEDIARDLASGRIGSVHVLKWRLFAALCNDVQIGVRLGDVWDAWNSMRALATLRSTENGWTAAEISTIDVYRGDKETRFYFASLAELRALMSQHFVERQCIFGQYELGDRCPIMVLAKPAA